MKRMRLAAAPGIASAPCRSPRPSLREKAPLEGYSPRSPLDLVVREGGRLHPVRLNRIAFSWSGTMQGLRILACGPPVID